MTQEYTIVMEKYCGPKAVFLLTGYNIISQTRYIGKKMDCVVVNVEVDIASLLEINDVIKYANQYYQIKSIERANDRTEVL